MPTLLESLPRATHSKAIPPHQAFRLNAPVEIRHATHGRVRVAPVVSYHAREDQEPLLGFKEYTGETIHHQYTLLIYARALSIAIHGVRKTDKSRDVAEREWEGIREYQRSLRWYDADRDELDLASVRLFETPMRLALQRHGSWKAFLAQEQPEGQAMLDRLRQTDDGRTARYPLRDGGSLLSLSEVAVHTMARGQGLGTRLILHALWSRIRHAGDLVVLYVRPEFRTRYEDSGRRGSSADYRRLVEFFTRLGFYADDDAEEHIARKRMVPMYRHVGTFGLPFDGLGELSVLAGHSP